MTRIIPLTAAVTCGLLCLSSSNNTIGVVLAFSSPNSSSFSTRGRPTFLHHSSSRRYQTTTTTTAAADVDTRHDSPAAITELELEPMPWVLNEAKYGKYNQKYWEWCYSSVDEEKACKSYVCDNSDMVEGIIPQDLIGGTYYRTGPGNFERGNRRYEHALDGDGYVSAFTFFQQQDGACCVKYTGRFVETEYFVKEKEEDKILYRNVFGTQRDGGFLNNVFDVNLKNVANTNIINWDNRLFVLWEAGRPYELDPITLQTLPLTNDGDNDGDTSTANAKGPNCELGNDGSMRGVTLDDSGPIDTSANLGRSFTAHPHIINNGQTLVAFKSGQHLIDKSIRMEFIEYDTNWNEITSTKYSIPKATAAPHDFAISSDKDYYCFIENQFNIDTMGFLLGLKAPTQAMQLLLDQPSILHLVPRGNGSGSNNNYKQKALQLEIPSYFNIHMVPSVDFDEGNNKLSIYSNGWDLNDGRFFPSGQKTAPFLGSWGGTCPDFESGIVPPALLYRTVVDLNSEKIESHEEVIPGLVMEFPVQDERNSNIVYCSTVSTDYTSMPGTGLGKVNLEKNTVEYWWASNKIFTGELHPVPKQNGEEGSWLMTILYDAGKKCATFAILDSEKFTEGPICSIRLPHALAYSLHGSFSRGTEKK